MRKFQVFPVLACLAGAHALFGLTGCGGGDEPAPVAEQPDTGAPTPPPVDVPDAEPDPVPVPDAGEPDAAVGEASAVAQPVTVYLGQGVTLDGSASTGDGALTYSWTIKDVPTGSAITSASLTDAATDKTSFVPDTLGAYTLTLEVKAGAASATTEVTATVVDAPIFYVHTESADGGTAQDKGSLKVVGAGAGAGGTSVSCFANNASAIPDTATLAAVLAADWWEAPAGEPSRAVVAYSVLDGEDRVDALSATTSIETCASSPPPLDTAASLIHPRFSPNGDRVAYIRSTDEGSTLATVGFDGSSRRVVGAWYAMADGSPDPSQKVGYEASRPDWVDDTTVAWVQALEAGTTWRVVAAPDAPDAPLTTLMSCTGPTPRQFRILPSGDVVVTQSLGDDQPQDLLVYPVDAASKECGTPKNLTNFEVTDTGTPSTAIDFSLSPDKTRIAYLSSDASTGVIDIRVVPVDGSSPPAPVASPLAAAHQGPRWVAGGAFITWGISAEQLDAGAPGAGAEQVIAVVASNGAGPARAAAVGPAGTKTYAVGNGGCSFGPAVGSGVSLFGITALAGLRLVRRRRRG